MNKRKFILGLAAIILAICSIQATNPKREFRGAWMHTIFQSQYARQSTSENQAYLIGQLDKLQAAGINAVVWQIRPQADALYPSELEPWSRHLTGKAGVAPNPMWDPLQFMIDECHKRGMELHAWLNPYRVTTSPNEELPKNHIYYQHPERFVSYDRKLYFDPGLPENRDFIEQVVGDIISRYDVDAIHMDDYFYPYPVAGKDFPDSLSYEKYGNGMNRGDWRRQNVDMLIEGLHKVISEKKPWIRLGISPFGIWRNKANDPKGSDTNGLENYDALYADVLLWSEKGWVDYMLPQLYWSLEHKRASAEKLAYWWNENANGRHMYFGQDLKVTMDTHDINRSSNPTQLAHKIALSRELPNVQGNCWWPGYMITSNYKGCADSLASNQQFSIALVPNYPWIDNIAPDTVSGLKLAKKDGQSNVSWSAPSSDDVMQQAHAYVVYVFKKGENQDLENSSAIKAVTYVPEYSFPAKTKGKFIVIVTTLDRANNESIGSKPLKVNL